MFRPDQAGQIIISDVGIVFWIVGLIAAIASFGFGTVFRTYIQVYFWCVGSVWPVVAILTACL